MTTPTDGAAPVANASPAPDVQSVGADRADVPTGTPEPEPSPNSEAARYRVQLREAEAKRDTLTERLTGYQRRECEAAVADLLDVPGDLWEVGQADVGVFYNDDGTVNADDLRAAAAALIEQRPRLGKPVVTQRWQNAGQHTGKPPGKTGWDSVINSG
jgi:hypothetical protein